MAHEMAALVDKNTFLPSAELPPTRTVNPRAIAYKLALLLATLTWLAYAFWRARQRPLSSPFPQLIYAGPVLMLITLPVIGSLVAILSLCLSRPEAFDLSKLWYRQLYLPVGVEGVVMIGGAFIYYPWQGEWILLVWMQTLGLGLVLLYSGAMFIDSDIDKEHTNTTRDANSGTDSGSDSHAVSSLRKVLSALTHPVQ